MASGLSKAASFRNALQQALPKSLSPNSSYSSHRSDSGHYAPLSYLDHDPDLDPDDRHDGHRIQMSADMSVDMSIDMSVDTSADLDYTVHIPPTPDNQPMSAAATAAAGTSKKAVTGTLFSRGPDRMLRTRTLKQRTGSQNPTPTPAAGTERQITRIGASCCSTRGCGGDPLRDELGQILFPCECRYLICRDCYWEALQNGETGVCPGCKEAYWIADDDSPDESSARGPPPLPLPAPNNSNAQLDRRISLLKPVKSLVRTRTSDFDQSSWLYSSKGTYGYGNAVWPGASSGFVNGGGAGAGRGGADLGPRPDFKELARRPLTRKIRIPAGILSPYRLLVLIRLVALSLFLMWRVKNINHDAIWLWGMSVVCEIWFAFSWLLDQLPKLNPVNRAVDLACLRDKFESPSLNNPEGISDLPGIDVFVSTADAEKEPPLVTANTILSILAIEYPVDKLACYLSDDGGALNTFEAQAEAASFAKHWVPFCRKHNIEPRNPESYFGMKGDPTKNKVRPDFVKDRRRIKREYDEFKVRINGLPDAIRRRSDAFNAHQEARARRAQMESGTDLGEASQDILAATWMADGTHWPGTWTKLSKEHSKGDHAGIIQVMLEPPSSEPVFGNDDEDNLIDTTDVDIRLPTLAYVSREKHSGYDHNKKAGAMNALVRASAVMTNGAFILNLDCDHYVYNSMAVREGMCFMMDRGGENICFVQFPQRFEGIDPSDRYANHNTVFFDGNMRALDGLQGPMYVGTGCLFRRVALYGFDPPRMKDRGGICPCCGPRTKHLHSKSKVTEMGAPTTMNGGFSDDDDDDNMGSQLLPKKFGNSNLFLDSIGVAEKQGRPLQDHPCVKYGRKPGSLIGSREPLDAPRVAEALSVISCWYEDKTEWGRKVGWIYGSVTEDVVTGYCMHKKGWRSIYCVTKRDAFRGTAPINLTDRLHQVLRWATGSVEIFFSRNNGFLAGSRMKILQRIAYLNVGIYPFTSIFLVVYCFLPALSLFTNQFIVQTLSVTFLVYLLSITITLCLLAILEIKWAGITLEDWWRNEQFWLIGGTSAHLVAVLQGLLKVIAGIQISFTLTSKSANDEENDSFADLYIVKWSSLMIPPLTIMMVNMIAIVVGVARTIYSTNPEWSKLLGGGFFSLWVLMHLYPFAKGLMGRRGRTPTIIWVWSGLISITISLLWVAITNPSSSSNGSNGTGFQFP